jgi:glucose/arabinose dehydrogenase
VRGIAAFGALAALALGASACGEGLPSFNAPLLPMLFGYSVGAPPDALTRERFQLAPGYALGRFAEELDQVRFLRVTPRGDVLASQSREGKVVLLLRDADGDGRADGRQVLLSGLRRPHGMDLHDGWLYVAETDAVGRVRFDPQARSVSGDFERIVRGLPGGGNHWSRTLRFGPDGWMYVSIGSSCNVCQEKDPRRATIVRYRPDGSGEEIYARGLRNSVGLDWRPETGELFATDNGRDLLGDDFPPCELNRIEPGAFYGWPYANGDRVRDPDLGAGRDAELAATHAPVHGFRAHTAPLGIAFLRHPAQGEYRGAALVALHGSWNRSRKDGYSVVSLHWNPDGSIQERDFLTGFERDEEVIGRPVDVAEDADGVIYVSDDHAGVIWRIARGAPGALSPASTSPTRREPLALDPAAVARGRALWDAHACATCHDPARAAAGVVARPLAGLAARHDVASLAALLETPPPPMPVAPLSPEERADLAGYLLATAP